jgi:hypothetical protein
MPADLLDAGQSRGWSENARQRFEVGDPPST